MFGAFQTFGKLGAIGKAIAAAWSPLALWPDGVDSPGMWIDPSLLTASFNDYTGTTPVATPGTVADSANPVGLALDIRAGAPEVLGPEFVVNGDFSNGTTGWTDITIVASVSDGVLTLAGGTGYLLQAFTTVIGSIYKVTGDIIQVGTAFTAIRKSDNSAVSVNVVTLASEVGSASSAFVATASTTYIVLQQNYSVVEGKFDNISVREIPGHHMLQSTAAARPLESARVNLLTYTEDFYKTGSPWFAAGFSASSTANNLIPSTSSAAHTFGQNVTVAVGAPVTAILRIKPNGYNTAVLQLGGCTGNPTAFFNASTGVISSTSGSPSASMDLQSDGSYICQIHGVSSATTVTITSYVVDLNDTSLVFAGDGTKALNYISAQINIGPEALPYQSVPGDGSTYTSTGVTPFQRYDGVDDGMATASFAAGALINGMDCMIAVRRDSAANCVAGLYNAVADATRFFGVCIPASSGAAVGTGSGTPTVWVDGVQLSGGTAVTAGTLHVALTTGAFHILEFRGLNLATWTAAMFGSYGVGSWQLNGARGDIMLYPSTASTTDKDAARQYLADKYGVTLP